MTTLPSAGAPTSVLASPAAPPASAPLGSARLHDLVRRIAAREWLWLPKVRFESPERYYVRLEHTAAHEVWLLTWLHGQGTDIHDHGGSRGAFTVVRGELSERVFTPPPAPAPVAEPDVRRLTVGAARAFGPRYVHQVTNEGAVPAVSVHAYSPPLSTMSYYRRLPDGSLVTERTEGVDR